MGGLVFSSSSSEEEVEPLGIVDRNRCFSKPQRLLNSVNVLCLLALVLLMFTEVFSMSLAIVLSMRLFFLVHLL